MRNFLLVLKILRRAKEATKYYNYVGLIDGTAGSFIDDISYTKL